MLRAPTTPAKRRARPKVGALDAALDRVDTKLAELTALRHQIIATRRARARGGCTLAGASIRLIGISVIKYAPADTKLLTFKPARRFILGW